MYVERYTPANPRPIPVVMFHGGVQTASNFIGTPDGRPGWLDQFLAEGYVVYLVDQPERGRSGRRLKDNQTVPLRRYNAKTIEERFTACASANRWPQAHRHTRWPGTGKRGDAAFDQFFASQVDQLDDAEAIESLTRDAGVALLDQIGEAIVLTHSQSGPFGWLLADARPDKVAALLSVEPNGPPFRDIEFQGAPNWFAWADAMARPYGITRMPLQFEPPVGSPEELAPQLASEKPADPEQVHGLMPGCDKRTLPNLAGTPILILTAEASYHAAYDQVTSDFLNWAGVAHDFVRLEDRGIRGNGHMVMLEEGCDEIARLMFDWLGDNLSRNQAA
jgi:pimeloyl-ACP methyl ester carboxylesterase